MIQKRLTELINQVSAKISNAADDINYFKGARDAFQLLLTELSELPTEHDNHRPTEIPTEKAD